MTGEEKIRQQDATAILAGMLILVGSILFSVIAVLISRKIKSRRFTVEVQATFDYGEIDPKGFSFDFREHKDLQQTIKFEYNGRKYEISRFVNGEDPSITDRKARILIDPNAPETGFCLLAENGKPRKYNLETVAPKVILLAWAISIVLMVILSKIIYK